MYTGLLHTHSTLRYIVLLLLVIVVITSLIGWISRKKYTGTDNRLSLFLFIATHTQLLIGLILYFVSPWVKFGSTTMSDAGTRYWTVEHITIMLIAIVMISLARIKAKKRTEDIAKHRTMFIYTATGLLLVLAGILMSGRGLFGSAA